MAFADIFTRPRAMDHRPLPSPSRRQPTLVDGLLAAPGLVGEILPAAPATVQAPGLESTTMPPAVDTAKASIKTLQRRLLVSSASLALSLLGAPLLSPLGLLGTAGFVYGAIPVFRNAYKALWQEKKANVDVLVSLTFAVCFTQGDLAPANLAIWFNALRLLLLAKINGDTQKNVFDLYQLQPRTVWLMTEDAATEVPFAIIQVNDIVVVSAGEMIPVDGLIVEGVASIDQQILTGEAQPVEKGEGDQVFASTVVLMGTIQVRVMQTGMATTIARIAETLNGARDFKTALQLRAETFADQTIPPILLLSLLATPLLGPMGALVILNAHFGYRLSVIGSISILTYLNVAGKHGLLIKDGRALDRLQQVDTVVFDKTGTLTQEQPHVAHIHTWAGYSEMTILGYAAAAEAHQTHPIARAIQHAAAVSKLPLLAVAEADYKVGYGLRVVFEQQELRVGSRRFMTMEGLTLPESVAALQDAAHEQGHSLVFVAVEQQVVGALEIQATVRPEARSLVAQLKRHYGIQECYIISGDHRVPTQKLAHELGIDHYFAETLPHQKAELIEQLKAAGKTVCYVGDGINDAIALQKADVSISLAGASTIATDTAQIILLDASLQSLERLFQLGRGFDRNMKINFAAIILPSLLGIGGAFFLNFGLIHSILINQVGFVVGVGNAMTPLASPSDTVISTTPLLTLGDLLVT